ncbi:hypothetical protein FRC03_012796 [Tulasnella sp. 419]|nr:hypothetical protein FRC03_012796 [Tulasnella sp. 419]
MFYSQSSRPSFYPVDLYYGIPQHEKCHSHVAPEFVSSPQSGAEQYYRRLADEHRRQAELALARARQEEQLAEERRRQAAVVQFRRDQVKRQLQQRARNSVIGIPFFHESPFEPVVSIPFISKPSISEEQQLRNEREARLEAYLKNRREKERREQLARNREQGLNAEANAIAEIMALLGLENDIGSDGCAAGRCGTGKVSNPIKYPHLTTSKLVFRPQHASASPSKPAPLQHGLKENQPVKSVRIQEPTSVPVDVKGKGKEVRLACPCQRKSTCIHTVSYRQKSEETPSPERTESFDPQAFSDFISQFVFSALPQPDVAGSSSSTRSSGTRFTYRSTPSPASPVKTPSPSKASPDQVPQVPKETPELRRTASLDSISGLQARFDSLKATFTFPSNLEFDSHDSTPTLLYNSNNAPFSKYENDLTRLLTKLDEVESNGDENIREVRKRLVRSVEAELDSLDKKKAGLWEASKKSEVTVIEEATVAVSSVEQTTQDSQTENAATVPEVEDVTQEKPTNTSVDDDNDSSSTPVIASERPDHSTPDVAVPSEITSDVSEESPASEPEVTRTPEELVSDDYSTHKELQETDQSIDSATPGSAQSTEATHELQVVPEQAEVAEVSDVTEAQPQALEGDEEPEEPVPTSEAPFLTTMNPIDDSTLPSVQHSLTLPEVDPIIVTSPTPSEKSLVDVSVDDIRQLPAEESSDEEVVENEDHSDNEFEML